MREEDLERKVGGEGGGAGEGDPSSASVAIAVHSAVVVVDGGERDPEARSSERLLHGDGATRAIRPAHALVCLDADQIDARRRTNGHALPERPFTIVVGEVGAGGEALRQL